ncbi:MAG TPA: response regulator [Anaerolineaceae bacterium]
MNEAKARLLIVEDDLDIAEMLDAYFRMQGFGVTVVNWGEEGVSCCLNQQPDLVILDIRLPDIDGFEVARRIRANRRTRDLPIIFLTEKRERADRLEGLSLKAEDYITKPFDIQELRLRVVNTLERNRRVTLNNTVTGLPEGELVDERVLEYAANPDYAISVLSLKNLGRFREVYGFVASDDLLRAISLMLQESLRENAAPDSFLGHLDLTNFILISKQSAMGGLKDTIRKRLAQSFEYFYRDQDRDTDLFRDHRLAIEMYDYTPGPERERNIRKLRSDLERLAR